MGDSLYRLVRQHPSLSIIGMCKNAGKTTALNHIIAGYRDQKKILALTSIGRDGEATDLVTGTRKPGIYIHAGTLVATARKLLALSDVTREILETTGMSTPMGEVVLARALSDGNIQLAGPSMVDQLVRLSERFAAHGAQRVLIDGAISRKTLCTRRLAEGTVLCTGASCGRDMDEVVDETAHVAGLLMLPVVRQDTAEKITERGCDPGGSLLITDEGALPVGKSRTLTDALRQTKNVRAVYVDGALSDGLVQPLLQTGGLGDTLTLVVGDASKILLSRRSAELLGARGWRLGVMERINLVAVTVNPFSAYGYDFDKEEFRQRVAQAVPVPVVNVEERGDD